jgi:hypothetical protein
MKGVLSKEPFQTLETTIDQVFQEVFADIAEIRLMDLEPVLDLTPEQTTALTHVLLNNEEWARSPRNSEHAMGSVGPSLVEVMTDSE